MISTVADDDKNLSIKQEVKAEVESSDNANKNSDINSTEKSTESKSKEEENKDKDKDKDKSQEQSQQANSKYYKELANLLKDFFDQYEEKENKQKKENKSSFSFTLFLKNIFISFPQKVGSQIYYFLKNPITSVNLFFYWSMLQIIKSAFSESNKIVWQFFEVYEDRNEFINSMKKARDEGRLFKEIFPKALPLAIFSFVPKAKGIIGILSFFKEKGKSL